MTNSVTVKVKITNNKPWGITTSNNYFIQTEGEEYKGEELRLFNKMLTSDKVELRLVANDNKGHEEFMGIEDKEISLPNYVFKNSDNLRRAIYYFSMYKKDVLTDYLIECS
tara:strand:- start:511 stop:843 length:333 start_codon:yes stop_codon:yes gene_type:complete